MRTISQWLNCAVTCTQSDAKIAYPFWIYVASLLQRGRSSLFLFSSAFQTVYHKDWHALVVVYMFLNVNIFDTIWIWCWNRSTRLYLTSQAFAPSSQKPFLGCTTSFSISRSSEEEALPLSWITERRCVYLVLSNWTALLCMLQTLLIASHCGEKKEKKLNRRMVQWGMEIAKIYPMHDLWNRKGEKNWCL